MAETLMKKGFLATGLALLEVLFWAQAVFSQGVVPVGGHFQVNSYTSGSQSNLSAAALTDGGFVAVWRSLGSGGSDSSSLSVQGQRYASDGTAVGSEFQVNSYTTRNQSCPAVAALADGGFVAAWCSVGSSGSDNSSFSIQGQRYASDGTAVGGEFQINSHTDYAQVYPTIAGLADGGFVAMWGSEGANGSDTIATIQGQRYSPDGTTVGGEFQVDSHTSDIQGIPSVAGLADGGFLAVWENHASTSDSSIQGQRFASDGSAMGGEFQVNSTATGFQVAPSVAAVADGGFVVVWESDASSGSDTSRGSIQGQRYASDGTTAGGEFQVNSYTTDDQRSPGVTALDGGAFIVTWEKDDIFGSSIRGQRYALDGQPLSGEFQINSEFSSGQSGAVAAALADGGFATVWQSRGSNGSDTSALSIQGQRFAAPRFALVGLAGKCLDVEGADPTDGTRVNLFRCNGGENQRWRFDVTDHPQRIVGLGGKCLIPGPVDASGDIPLEIGPCGGTEALWRLALPGHAQSSVLIHDSTGLCLDVEGAATADGTPVQLFECHGGANQLWRPATEVCTPDLLGLCLEQDRFRVDLAWRSFDGTTGSGKAVPVGTDDSGVLWFFEAENWEMLVKVLDGCAINDRFWVFAGATTTVEYTLRVTDIVLGTVVEYFNPLGNAAAAITDTDAFATCSATPEAVGRPPAVEAMFRLPPSGTTIPAGFVADEALAPEGACVPSLTQMCLSNDRFSVEVDWRDHAGNFGSGRVVGTNSPDSGLFWFFNSTNWEVLIKVLDACHLEDPRFLMLAAATTDVEYTLRVTDTQTGDEWQYFNPLGNAAAALVDSFETCP